MIVWCVVWSKGIIEPYFSEHENGVTVTVNGKRYRDTIENFLSPQSHVLDLTTRWSILSYTQIIFGFVLSL